MSKLLRGDRDVELLIGRFLQAGVIASCSVAVIGGVFYLWHHGLQPIPDYTTFAGEPAGYTTLPSILKGLVTGSSRQIIQFAVVLLIATPILRIVLSLFSFILEKDRMYICITLIVLCIILFSMFSGLKV